MKTLYSKVQELKIPKEIIPILDTTIMLAYRGSISHGTYIPNKDPNSIDDIDIIGAFFNPLEYYFGLSDSKRKGHLEVKKNEWDAVSYELKKLFNLLIKQNPNVLMLLFLKEEHIIHKTDVWQMIIDNKDAFISKYAYHSFAGYANDQLKRMTHFKYEGYMGQKRKSLVERYGYDCKNAAHLIRLLTMCIEYLNTGHMNIDRTEIDAQLFIDIKTGKYKLNDIKEMAEILFEEARFAFEQSNLPEEVNRDKAEVLLVEILKNYFKI